MHVPGVIFTDAAAAGIVLKHLIKFLAYNIVPLIREEVNCNRDPYARGAPGLYENKIPPGSV